MAFAFGPSRRLRSHAEFVRAQRTGRRVSTAHFTLLIAPQMAEKRRSPSKNGAGDIGSEAGAAPDCVSSVAAKPARIGLVVARKVGGAVQRNRVKRVCRECFRLWPDLLPAGVDLVVIARPGAHELGLEDVRSEWATVTNLLRKRAAEALARRGPPPHLARAGS